MTSRKKKRLQYLESDTLSRITSTANFCTPPDLLLLMILILEKFWKRPAII